MIKVHEIDLYFSWQTLPISYVLYTLPHRVYTQINKCTPNRTYFFNICMYDFKLHVYKKIIFDTDDFFKFLDFLMTHH